MSRLSEMLSNLTWRDDDLVDLRQRLAGAELDDDLLREVFLDAGLAINTQPKPIDPGAEIPRFFRAPAREHAEAAAHAENRFSHPYTAGVLLDYAAEGTPRSARWKELGLRVAAKYVEAVERFGDEGPRDHILGISDAVIRSRFWSNRVGGTVDPLIDALVSVTKALEGTPHAPLLGPLAQAISFGTRPKAGSKAKFGDLYRRMRAAVEGIQDLRQKTVCALDLEPLSRLAGEAVAQDEWVASTVADAALGRADNVSPLVAASELHFAARLTRDKGHLKLGDVVAKLEELNPALQDAGTDVRVAKFAVSMTAISAEADLVRAGQTVSERMERLAALPMVPTVIEINTNQQSFLAQNSLLSLVTFTVIGPNGPTGENLEEFAKWFVTEHNILLRSAILSEVVETVGRATAFPPTAVNELFDAGLLRADQVDLYAGVWNAWAQGEHGVALFGLFPMLEHVLRSACARVGLTSTSMARDGGMAVKHGGTLTDLVREGLGPELAVVVEHLLDRPNASRHGFAHGYAGSEEASKARADYLVFLLCRVLGLVIQAGQHRGSG